MESTLAGAGQPANGGSHEGAQAMTTTTSLLVIGAGPYGLSTAAFAREHGIDTVVLGRPMSF